MLLRMCSVIQSFSISFYIISSVIFYMHACMHSDWFSLMIYWRTDVQMMSSLKIFLNSLLYKTNRFQVSMHLFSNRSQRMSKCGKNISDTLGCASCATFLFLLHFDIICDLFLNRRMATWNLFVKLSLKLSNFLILCSVIDH